MGKEGKRDRGVEGEGLIVKEKGLIVKEIGGAAAAEIGDIHLPRLPYFIRWRPLPDHLGNFVAPAQDLDRQLFLLVFIRRIAPPEEFRIKSIGRRDYGNSCKIRLEDFPVSDVNLNAAAHGSGPFLEGRLEIGRAKPNARQAEGI
jgi:hypothetical protein